MGFLQRFFYGRNGNDHLNTAIFVVVLIFMALQLVTGLAIFMYIYYICIAVYFYRALSRNISKRQTENAWFMSKTGGIRKEAKLIRNRFKDRKTYKYLKCPNCKKHLRVPRGKGNIKIRCSQCHLEFFKKV